MTFYNKYRTDKADEDINLFFYREKCLNNESVDKSKTSGVFESIAGFYAALEGNNFFTNMKIRDCLALRLAGVIINELNSGNYKALEGCSPGEDFYLSLADVLFEREDNVSDKELLVIYLKQTVHMLREKGLIFEQSGLVRASDSSISSEKLYKELINSFWNVVDWKGIFPSSPEAAEKVYENKNTFIELLLEYYTEVRADDLAGDFLEIADISEKDDQFLISFMGFYLFSWFANFGIIDYVVSDSGDDYYLSVDDYGRNIISVFLG